MDTSNIYKAVIQGDDGRNYDEHLEHLFQVFVENDFSERDIIIHNLKMYSATFCEARVEMDESILDDTEATLKWAASLSGVQVWALTEHQKEKHSMHTEHVFGAYMIGGNQPVTGHTPRSAILLAVVQRFREAVSVELNPVRRHNEKLH